MENTWKTFLCYKEENDSPLKYSKLFADVLYDNMTHDGFFNPISPVLYKEKHRALSSFDESGIRKFMPNIKFFIPIITPDFFDDVLDIASVDDKTYEKGIPVYFKEFTHAICSQCIIYPIYIAEKSQQAFLQDAKNKKAIEELLLKTVEYVSNRYTLPFNKSILNSFISTIFTNPNPLIVSPSIIKKILEGNKKEKNNLSVILNETFSPIITQAITLFIPKDTFLDSLLTDLYKIHYVIQRNGYPIEFQKNIMDTDAYQRLTISDKPLYYCISSAYIHGVPYLKDTNHDKKTGIGRGYFDIKNSCQFADEDIDYFYWPTSLAPTRNNNPIFFNVCAISLGVMMLNNWYRYDRSLYNSIKTDEMVEISSSATVYNQINQSINLLMSLRDYYNMSWLSRWNFGLKLGAEAGTINQTTLSISALLTCRFLDLMPDETDNEKLFNRIKYIDNSLAWLEKKMLPSDNVTDNDGYYWGNGYSYKLNISLSLFCLDVYTKYYSKIHAVALSKGKDELRVIRGTPYKNYCEDIKSLVNNIVLGLATEIPIYIDTEVLSNHDKLLIYSKVLKSFCAYITLEKKINSNNVSNICRMAQDLSSKALTFLYENKELIKSFTIHNCKLLVEYFPHIIDHIKDANGESSDINAMNHVSVESDDTSCDHECSECDRCKKCADCNICSNCNHKHTSINGRCPLYNKCDKYNQCEKCKDCDVCYNYDQYDNCAELLFIEALMKAVELDIQPLQNIKKDDLIATIKESLQWFQINMIDRTTSEFIRIKGHVKIKNNLASIYAYYYYRMVIYDYILFMQRLEDNNTHTSQTSHYKIGITFSGNYRKKYVEPAMVELLEKGFSKDDIFYDYWHQARINGVNGDSILRDIYMNKCDCVVVLLSPDYKDRNWPGMIEWPAVEELINTGDARKLCLLGIDSVNVDEIDGLNANRTIVQPIDNMSPSAIANFIYEKYNLITKKQ